MELRKIKESEVAAVRKELLEKQRYVCPITGRDLRAMKPINLVLDHCHTGGHIRAVLPRGINGLEGAIKAALHRYAGLSVSQVPEMASILHKLADYLMLHRVPQHPYIYHKHKTELEKRAARNTQARKRYALKKTSS